MLAIRIHLIKKRKKSKVLVSCIKRTSFEIFLCFRYKKQNLKYVVLNKENFSYCFKYCRGIGWCAVDVHDRQDNRVGPACKQSNSVSGSSRQGKNNTQKDL